MVLAILITGCSLMSKAPWEMNLVEENKATKETMPSPKGGMPWEMGLVDESPEDYVTEPDIFERERNQIREDEGTVYESYTDSRGILTGGVGRNLEDRGLADKYPKGTKIPEEVVEQWYKEDFGIARKDADQFVGDASVPDEVRAVLTNMALNMGITRLNKFTDMKAAMVAGDWKEMAKEMKKSDWFKQVPNRAGRLIKRVELLGSERNNDRG